MEINAPVNVRQIIRKLQAAGYEGHVVGGAVRDSLIGKCPKDYDVTTNATPDEIMKVFPGKSLYTNKFGTVVVRTTMTTITLGDAPVPVAPALDLRATIRSRKVSFKEMMAGKWIRTNEPLAPDPEGDAIIAMWERRLKRART